MIGGTTQNLFRDAFGQQRLFAGMPAINKRVVAWGPDSDTRVLPHSAVVASEQDLLEKLRTPSAFPDATQEVSWTVIASRPLPDACAERHFGWRTARAMPVRLREGADSSACWIESLESGWMFLIPNGPTTGWLLAVGDLGESSLAGSRLISGQIAEITGAHTEFPSYPRIGWPLCGPGWLTCGAGALAFDPLCGDGSGNAIREAILATAVLRCISKGGNREELLAHYRSRLLAGFKRHLETCEGYYRSGGSTPWWRMQLEAVHTGLEWCANELGRGPAARYRLRGFDLEPIPMISAPL